MIQTLIACTTCTGRNDTMIKYSWSSWSCNIVTVLPISSALSYRVLLYPDCLDILNETDSSPRLLLRSDSQVRSSLHHNCSDILKDTDTSTPISEHCTVCIVKSLGSFSWPVQRQLYGSMTAANCGGHRVSESRSAFRFRWSGSVGAEAFPHPCSGSCGFPRSPSSPSPFTCQTPSPQFYPLFFTCIAKVARAHQHPLKQFS